MYLSEPNERVKKTRSEVKPDRERSSQLSSIRIDQFSTLVAFVVESGLNRDNF